MLYTRKGDNGTTKVFDCPQGVRMKKSSAVFIALGTLDELNSSIGYAKVLSGKSKDRVGIFGKQTSCVLILEKIQNILFTIQAELGGSQKSATESDVLFSERVVYEVETLILPINTFIVCGGGETGAYLDVCRTIARRAERAVLIAIEQDNRKVSDTTLQFLNRLSSVLYALARFANYQEGFSENRPSYSQ